MSPNPMITSKPIKLGSIAPPLHHQGVDRKSTRLNSSHGYISYAVFCLKKKKRISRSFEPDAVDWRVLVSLPAGARQSFNHLSRRPASVATVMAGAGRRIGHARVTTEQR